VLFTLWSSCQLLQKIITFQQIPSHIDIENNEKVDKIARTATMLQPTLQTVMSLKASTSAMNKKKHKTGKIRYQIQQLENHITKI
jgi:hypothetical protein